MAKTKVYQYYTELPQWAKGVVIVATVGAIGIVGYGVYKQIKNAIAKAKADDAVKEANKELNNLAKNGVKPSYSDTQYKMWANAMHECFNGIGTCTGDTIFVNLKNDADMLKLISAYGVRTINSGIIFVPDFTGDLAGAMRSESTPSTLDDINKRLAKKNISYKF